MTNHDAVPDQYSIADYNSVTQHHVITEQQTQTQEDDPVAECLATANQNVAAEHDAGSKSSGVNCLIIRSLAHPVTKRESARVNFLIFRNQFRVGRVSAVQDDS